MLRLSIADAKAQFTNLLHEVQYDQQRFIITKKAKEVAALISLEDLDMLKILASQWFLAQANQALDEIKTAGTLSLVELEELLGD